MVYIVGLSGAPFTGKKLLCKELKSSLEDSFKIIGKKINVVILSLEYFYKLDNYKEPSHLKLDYDHPKIYEYPRLLKVITEIKNHKPIEFCKYDYKTRTCELVQIENTKDLDVVLIEGTYLFRHYFIKELLDLKIFINADDETSLSCRVMAEYKEDGEKTLKEILSDYHEFHKKVYKKYCLPKKKDADILLNYGNTVVAKNLIVDHICDVMQSFPDQDSI